MITMSNFGNNGRLGNQLFQYASMMGFANKLNSFLILPKWEYSKYFNGLPYEGELPLYSKIEVEECDIKEINPIAFENQILDFNGYFQDHNNWKKEEIKEQFTFNLNFINSVSWVGQEIDYSKTIAIHIRRGDYVNNNNYEYLPITYYINALEEYFPDWRNKYNLMFFSDDIEYCKTHFECLGNAFFSEGNEIEDLARMSLCQHFILSNSTFAWWGAYLGEKKDSIVIRSNRYYRNELLHLDENLNNYYPKNWINNINFMNQIDLTDVTFTIPCKYDHEDRYENLELLVNYLKDHFNTNITIAEQGTHELYMNESEYIVYNVKIMPQFHRTQLLNYMAREADTNIIVNQDTDVFIVPMQIIEAVRQLRGNVDVCFPYDGTFKGIKRKKWYQTLKKYLDIALVKKVRMKGGYINGNTPKDTTGGCIMFKRESFIKGGMENENFISWGPEDYERKYRFETLGFNVKRIKGALYHLDHWVGEDSGKNNPYFENNNKEFLKVTQMDKKELTEYIKTWKWIQ